MQERAHSASAAAQEAAARALTPGALVDKQADHQLRGHAVHVLWDAGQGNECSVPHHAQQHAALQLESACAIQLQAGEGLQQGVISIDLTTDQLNNNRSLLRLPHLTSLLASRVRETGLPSSPGRDHGHPSPQRPHG